MKKSWLAKATLALSLLFLAFSLMQYSRRMDYAALLEIPPCFRIGGKLHHYFEAGCREVSKISGIPYSINADGLRERSREEIGQGAILVLGDSMVEGKGVEFQFVLTQQLEKIIPIKFVNAGIRSRGPVIQSAHLPELLEKYRPRLIVWILNENDVDDDKLAFALSKKLDASGTPSELSTEDFDQVAWISTWRMRLGSLGGLLDQAVYFAYYRGIKQLLLRPNVGYRICAGMERGIQISKEFGIPLFIVVTPLGPNNPHKYLEKDFESMMGCLAGQEYLDLRRELIDVQDAFLPRDTHFGPIGHAWMAKKLAPAILERLDRQNKSRPAASLRKGKR